MAACGEPWVAGVRRVVASAETKSVEATMIIADHLGLAVEVRPDTGETDRSATGFVPHDEHERLADLFFGRPHESADGWKRAIDVQTRVAGALEDLLSSPHPIVVVGHGGAGTVWYCHLAGIPIARAHDQPHPGHYFAVDLATRRPLHHWHPLPDGAQIPRSRRL